MSAPTLDDLVEVLADARGCGCCASYGEADRVVPDGCPTEDGWTDHTYGDDCNGDFRGLARRVLAKAREVS